MVYTVSQPGGIAGERFGKWRRPTSPLATAPARVEQNWRPSYNLPLPGTSTQLWDSAVWATGSRSSRSPPSLGQATLRFCAAERPSRTQGHAQ